MLSKWKSSIILCSLHWQVATCITMHGQCCHLANREKLPLVVNCDIKIDDKAGLQYNDILLCV